MKKIIYVGILSINVLSNCATNTSPRWLSSKIINTTNVPAQITINYIPDCNKIPSPKEKNECLALGGNTLTLKLDPSKSIVLSDIISFVNVNKQCPQQNNAYENSIQVSFPKDEPGTTTYAPITLMISAEDLQKIKTYTIRLFAGKMSFK